MVDNKDATGQGFVRRHVDFRVDYRFTSHMHYYHFTIAATNNCGARCSTVLFWDDDYR